MSKIGGSCSLYNEKQELGFLLWYCDLSHRLNWQGLVHLYTRQTHLHRFSFHHHWLTHRFNCGLPSPSFPSSSYSTHSPRETLGVRQYHRIYLLYWIAEDTGYACIYSYGKCAGNHQIIFLPFLLLIYNVLILELELGLRRNADVRNRACSCLTDPSAYLTKREHLCHEEQHIFSLNCQSGPQLGLGKTKWRPNSKIGKMIEKEGCDKIKSAVILKGDKALHSKDMLKNLETYEWKILLILDYATRKMLDSQERKNYLLFDILTGQLFLNNGIFGNFTYF